MSGEYISPAWAQWMSYHATLFDLRGEPMEMLREWVELFDRAGWTAEELADASEWVAMNQPPKYPREQLRCLQDRVRAKRFEAARKRGGDDERRQCADCGGSGLVVVPHVRSAAGPGESWYTQAVACNCPLGDYFVQSSRYLSLGDYERVVPDWRRRIREHEAYLRRLTQKGPLSPAFEAALARLKARRAALGGN